MAAKEGSKKTSRSSAKSPKAKSAKKKVESAGKTAKKIRKAAKAPAAGGEVSHQQIAQRAYELYLQRGAVDGYAQQDWAQAEQELLGQAGE
jgi:hypothetical protein